MNQALSLALSSIRSGETNCVVLQKDQIVFQSGLRGVAPLLQLIENGQELLRGAAVADKLIGKAAAMLLVLGGAHSVATLTISESALQYLTEHGVLAEYETLTQRIVNRDGTALCPMETAIMDLTDPRDGLHAIRQALERLRNAQKI